MQRCFPAASSCRWRQRAEKAAVSRASCSVPAPQVSSSQVLLSLLRYVIEVTYRSLTTDRRGGPTLPYDSMAAVFDRVCPQAGQALRRADAMILGELGRAIFAAFSPAASAGKDPRRIRDREATFTEVMATSSPLSASNCYGRIFRFYQSLALSERGRHVVWTV
jgi:hypothetical protein